MRALPAKRYRRAMSRRRRLATHEFVPDPEQADQDAMSRHEMRAFDELSPVARSAIADSKFGVHVAETVRHITRAGVSDQVKRILKAEGLTGSDVGTEGVLLLELQLLEKAESARLAAEIERRVAPRSTRASPAEFAFINLGRWR